MSHCSVLVIGEDIEDQLKPFCEQEDENNTYHEFVDCTDKVTSDWLTETVPQWYASHHSSLSPELFATLSNSNGVDGVSIDITDDTTNCNLWRRSPAIGDRIRFYNGDQDPALIAFVELTSISTGDESTEITVKKIDPPAEILVNTKYADIEEYVIDYVGYDIVDGSYGYHTNPNAKWDWYQVGGRWAGFFKGFDDVDGEVGTAGLMTEPAKEGYYDSLLKRDIDVEYMRLKAKRRAEEEYDLFSELFEGIQIPSREELKKKHTTNTARRDAYSNSEYVKKLNSLALESEQNEFLASWQFNHDIAEYFMGFDRDMFIKKAMDLSLVTFAVLKDGKWYERGDLGWWGHVGEETPNWDEWFHKTFHELDDNTRLTVVDIHI